MVSKSSIAEIKSMKEGFLKEKVELERKIDVIDTVLKIFEKGDSENCSTGIRKVKEKDPDIEKRGSNKGRHTKGGMTSRKH